MRPQLSVIITWYDRPELRRTLDENRHVFDRHEAEVIVVNCGGSEAGLRDVLSGAGPRRLRRVDVQTTVFNKSLALNLGASVAQSDRLFLLDADIILKEDFLPAAFEAVAARRFFTVERVVESDPEPLPPQDHLEEMTNQLSFVGRGGRRATATVRRRFHEGSRNAPGLVVLAREHFLKVGGMNADLFGYGWEDRDLLLRLQFALGLEERSAGTVIHLSHKDESQHEAWRDRRKGEQLNFAACVKNYRAGHYAGTYYDDLSVWKEKFSLEDR
jgi:glycosyltransferase involved in cell wall biosynthesis